MCMKKGLILLKLAAAAVDCVGEVTLFKCCFLDQQGRRDVVACFIHWATPQKRRQARGRPLIIRWNSARKAVSCIIGVYRRAVVDYSATGVIRGEATKHTKQRAQKVRGCTCRLNPSQHAYVIRYCLGTEHGQQDGTAIQGGRLST